MANPTWEAVTGKCTTACKAELHRLRHEGALVMRAAGFLLRPGGYDLGPDVLESVERSIADYRKALARAGA